MVLGLAAFSKPGRHPGQRAATDSPAQGVADARLNYSWLSDRDGCRLPLSSLLRPCFPPPSSSPAIWGSHAADLVVERMWHSCCFRQPTRERDLQKSSREWALRITVPPGVDRRHSVSFRQRMNSACGTSLDACPSAVRADFGCSRIDGVLLLATASGQLASTPQFALHLSAARPRCRRIRDAYFYYSRPVGEPS